MGYTTKFKGRFVFDRLPSAQTIAALRQMEGEEVEHAPDSYCDWRLTKDCMGLEWTGAEKFYHYVEWLQFLYDTLLKADGIEITGAIKFQGEDPQDIGTIVFEGGRFQSRKEKPVSDSDLSKFRDFVLASDYADEILESWRRRK